LKVACWACPSPEAVKGSVMRLGPAGPGHHSFVLDR